MTGESFAHGLVGVTLDGRYRLDAVLGEGGMGSVFRATQLAMERKVAVKLLKPHLTSDEQALQRFAREANATLKVESPHAVKVLDFGVTPVRDYYMVLEYLDGRTVQRELEIDGPFAPARVVHIARQALDALGTSHASGLVHRDVKPDNLLLMRVGGDPDYTKVLDFGVAKLMEGAASQQLALTAAGMVFGTPEFMSPEQACGQPLDGRSDLYSLAVTMFVMLTGQPMYAAKMAIEWLTHHARTPAPRLASVRPELAAYPELDAVMQQCLAKAREQRPPTAAQMAAKLASVAGTLARAPATTGETATSATAETPALPSVNGSDDTAAAPVLAPRAPTPTTAKRALQSSGFVQALRATDLAPIVADSVAVAPIANARRARYVGVGAALAVLALVSAVVLWPRGAQPIAARPPVARPVPVVSAPTKVAERPAPTLAPEAKPTLAPEAKPALAPEAKPDPDVAPAKVAPPTSVAPNPTAAHAAPRAAANSEAEEHLRNAEAALRSNNNIRQLAEADLALRADPRSTRARYLLGDALIKSGDLDRGCTYLRPLKRVAAARERARVAGCPSD